MNDDEKLEGLLWAWLVVLAVGGAGLLGFVAYLGWRLGRTLLACLA